MSLLPENASTPAQAQTPVVPAKEEAKPGEQAAAPEPSWWWDENTPGVGDRPPYLQPKFKSVAEAAKSFNELEKVKGSAPQEYDFSKGSEWVKPDFEPLKEMATLAKSKHVPQEVMDKFLDMVNVHINQTKVNPEKEFQKLGVDAKERLDRLTNWAKSNLSEAAFNGLRNNMNTAESIQALEELRTKMISSTSMVPGGDSALPSGGYTLEQYRSELSANLPKYKTDPHFRKEMERKLNSIYHK